MRIGVDARELCGHPTGVGRYLEGLLREWAVSDRGRQHEFVLYAPDLLTVSLDTRRFATRIVGGRGGTVWEQRHLPRAIAADHLDVLFAPGYTAPLITRVPIVVAIHDVSFAAHPEWYAPREGLKRRLLCRRTAQRARAVVTISEFSRREIVERLRVPDDRVHVIPPGVTSPLQNLPDVRLKPDATKSKPDATQSWGPASAGPSDHGIRLKPDATKTDASVLYVGSIFTRRHVPDLIRAFSHLARSHADASLDLVGDNRSHPPEDIAGTISHLRLDGRARWHRYVSNADLARLYEQARAFAFLSEYEGLGFTPLEALTCGVPSVLLDTAIARESCGDSALYVEQGDIKATATTLERLLYDATLRETLLQAAPSVLARFSWPDAALRTLDVLERAS